MAHRAMRAAAVWLACAVGTGPALADAAADYAAALHVGDTVTLARLAEARLAEAPEDGQARFALGAAKFMEAVAGLGQGLHRHGLRPEYDLNEVGGIISDLPFLRLPVPHNPAPEPVTYGALRAVLERFAEDLVRAEETLAGVGEAPFDLPLDLAQLRLDFAGDGDASDATPLLEVFAAVSGEVEAGGGWIVDFDQSDAPWLRGYCHLLMALADFLLAHDWEEAFLQTMHPVFPDTDFPNSAMNAETAALLEAFRAQLGPDGVAPRYDDEDPSEFFAYAQAREALMMGAIADLVAFVHLFRWPVVEPERMGSAREQLLAMVAQSRENWRRIRAETDAKREWVPAPGTQEGIFPALRVTEETVAGWNVFLAEFEAVLEGEKLIPHWRFEGRGVDLRAMFEDPRTFDPVMIASGAGALPYLRAGETVRPETALEVLELTGGGFFAYFLWFN